MKVTLYMAISIDGFIAKKDGDSDWISENDIEIFDAICADADCIIVGNTTYKQYLGEIYPVEDTYNIIVSSNTGENTNNIRFSDSPTTAITHAKEKDFNNILLVGGGLINGSFLSSGLIDEIIIDIQPVILGDGIKLFEEIKNTVELDFFEHIGIKGGLNILKYHVKK